MHVTKTEFTLPTARAVEFQRHNERRAELLRQQPGFRGNMLLNSLGYPVMQMSPMYFRTTKYILLMQWDDAVAAEDCFRGPDWRDFTEQRSSERLFAPETPAEQYDTLDEYGRAVDGAPFGWLMQFDRTGSPEADALSSEVAELFARYQEQLPGFRQGRVLTQSRTPGHVLGVLLLSGQSEFPPGQAVPELAALERERIPEGDVGTRLVPEGVQVVQRTELPEAARGGARSARRNQPRVASVARSISVASRRWGSTSRMATVPRRLMCFGSDGLPGFTKSTP